MLAMIRVIIGDCYGDSGCYDACDCDDDCGDAGYCYVMTMVMVMVMLLGMV